MSPVIQSLPTECPQLIIANPTSREIGSIEVVSTLIPEQDDMVLFY